MGGTWGARWATLAVLAVVTAGCGGDGSSPSTTSTTTGAPASTTAPVDLDTSLPAVQELLDSAVDGPEGPVPAVLAAVAVGDGEPVTLAAGSADPEGSAPADPTGRVRIASVTKSVLAAIVGQLVDEGELALDDTLDGWYPQVAGSESITIDHLLRHTSGLPDWDALPGGIFEVIVGDPDKLWTTPEIVDLVDDLEPTFPPGTDQAYSNPGSQLLTAVVEQVTGQPFADLVAERVTGPLGLDDTALGPLDPHPDDYAYGMADIGDGLDYRDLPYIATESVMFGAAGMSSTPTDLVGLGRGLWRDGDVVSDEWRAEMVDVADVREGLGTQPFCPCPDDQPAGVGHTGEVAGSRTVVAHYAGPDVTIALVVMSNIVDRSFLTDLLESVATGLGA